MATEIIQTGDPNVVIERTTNDVEINIAQLLQNKLGSEIIIYEISTNLMELKNIQCEGILRELLDKDIYEKEFDLAYHKHLLDIIIDKLNMIN